MTDKPLTQAPLYRCHKEVRALKIAAINGKVITFEDERFGSLRCDVGMFARYVPVPGDYLVEYGDGFLSFSPAKAFEEGYTLIEAEDKTC